MPHMSPQSCWGLQSCSLSVPVPEMLQLSCSERQAQPQRWWLQLQRRDPRCSLSLAGSACRWVVRAQRRAEQGLDGARGPGWPQPFLTEALPHAPQALLTHNLCWGGPGAPFPAATSQGDPGCPGVGLKCKAIPQGCG